MDWMSAFLCLARSWTCRPKVIQSGVYR